jgi:hypothetical protein
MPVSFLLLGSGRNLNFPRLPSRPERGDNKNYQQESSERSQNRINNHASSAVSWTSRRQLQPQTSIDDAQEYQHTTVPNMQDSPRRAFLRAHVAAMMDISEEWLQEESSDHYRSENGVRVVVKLLSCVSAQEYK